MMSRLRTLAMTGAFIAGYFCPAASGWYGAVRYLIAMMMFFVLLQVHFSFRAFRREHLWILLANLAVGIGGWGVLKLCGKPELALAVFFTGITPTATAAPVIVGLLGERVDFAVTAFLVTNVGMALALPFLIPVAIGNPAPGVFWSVVGKLLFVIGLPALFALPLRLFRHDVAELPKKLKNLSFSLWVVTIFLIIANASAFLRQHRGEFSVSIVWEIALLSLAVCLVNFSLGRQLGGRRLRQEASQVLGQKNTSLTIYLAVSCANPLIALGPTFYVIWHNAWNTWQLYRHDRKISRRQKNFCRKEKTHV